VVSGIHLVKKFQLQTVNITSEVNTKATSAAGLCFNALLEKIYVKKKGN
jgi:hypothetical protein